MSAVGCHCAGNAACKLCSGEGRYDYVPGPRGWMPFACPTCDGKGRTAAGPCPTCRGAGSVDPADPPTKGTFDVVWKALFGA